MLWLFISFWCIVLGVLSLLGDKRAYFCFVILALVWFPVSAGGPLQPKPCELYIEPSEIPYALVNYTHIILFGMFFVMTNAQFGYATTRRALLYSGAATMGLGILVELSEAMTGDGTCRVLDLLPDFIGVGVGIGLVYLWKKLRTRLPFDPGKRDAV